MKVNSNYSLCSFLRGLSGAAILALTVSCGGGSGSSTPQQNTGPPNLPNGSPQSSHNIEGIVLGVDGNPISSQNVVFYDQNSLDSWNSDTDSNGSFLVKGIKERVDGDLVVDKSGFFPYTEGIGFVPASVDLQRLIYLIDEIGISSTFPEFKNINGDKSFLQLLKYLTGNRDGESLTGGNDPTRFVESWNKDFKSGERLSVTVDTGDVGRNRLVKDALYDLETVVGYPIFNIGNISNPNLGIRDSNSNNVTFPITHRTTIGANGILGLGAVSVFDMVIMELGRGISNNQLKGYVQRGVTMLLLGPNARHSVDPTHVTNNPNTRISLDEANVLRAYLILPSGYDLSNINE